jgi:periplasmic divalent cation tolerance protein
MEIRLIYVTTGSAAEGRNIGKKLVSERLVACVNMMENMQSIYWWKGTMEEEREVVLIAKTTAALVPQVVERVKSMHSYDCPCVVSLPILEGNQPFLDWIVEETR